VLIIGHLLVVGPAGRGGNDTARTIVPIVPVIPVVPMRTVVVPASFSRAITTGSTVVVVVIAIIPAIIRACLVGISLRVSPPGACGRRVWPSVRVIGGSRGIRATIAATVVIRGTIVVTLLPTRPGIRARRVSIVVAIPAMGIIPIAISLRRVVVAVIIPFGGIIMTILSPPVVPVITVTVPVITIVAPVIAIVIAVVAIVIPMLVPMVATVIPVVIGAIAILIVAIAVTALAIGAAGSVLLPGVGVLFFVPPVLVAMLDGPDNPGAFACTLFHNRKIKF
jgi:hypothetical protein